MQLCNFLIPTDWVGPYMIGSKYYNGRYIVANFSISSSL